MMVRPACKLTGARLYGGDGSEQERSEVVMNRHAKRRDSLVGHESLKKGSSPFCLPDDMCSLRKA